MRSENRGQKYTLEEDALIRDWPRTPGATAALAARLGRSRVAISMRRAQLEGAPYAGGSTVPAKAPRRYGPRADAVVGARRAPARPPTARPAWFDEPDLDARLRAAR